MAANGKKPWKFLGTITTVLLNTLFFLSTPWGVVVTFLGSISLVLWGVSRAVIQSPLTELSIGTFLAVLWTVIGLRVLMSFKQTASVKLEQTYEYCLNPEGYQFLIAEDDAFQIGFNFRNLSNGPIRVECEKFDLRIEDRSCPAPEEKIALVIPRVSLRGLRSGAFKPEVLKHGAVAMLDVQIAYGPPVGAPVRKYRFRTKLHLGLQKNEHGKIIQGGIVEEFLGDEDKPI